MNSIEEILEQLKHVEVSVRCRKCGAVPMLVGKQYTVRCPSCGTAITVTPNYLAMLKMREQQAKESDFKIIRRYQCNICKDQGYLVMEEQVNDDVYEFGYRCLCQAGHKRDDLAGWPVVPAAKVWPWLAQFKRQEINE
ncbi:MAG TPA: hypothetical protein PK728_05475 [Bacillota bacterium]|nr:hypothetical protein [Bacillota bacterium]